MLHILKTLKEGFKEIGATGLGVICGSLVLLQIAAWCFVVYILISVLGWWALLLLVFVL